MTIQYEKIENPKLTTTPWTRNKYYHWRHIVVNKDKPNTDCLSKVICSKDNYYSDSLTDSKSVWTPRFKTIATLLAYLETRTYKAVFEDNSWHYCFKD